MPNTARILLFPSRAKAELPSRTEILAQSGHYLSLSIVDRSAQVRNECLGNADTLLSVCSLLRDRTNTSPLDVAAEAADLYGWLSVHEGTVGFFDERDFFL